MMDIDFDELPQRKHKPPELRKKRNPGKFDHAQFIAWDGEGITDADGHHHYLLFANSRGFKVRAAIAQDGDRQTGVSTESALRLLIETARANPRALHVIYYGSYDFNMFLRDVPRNALDRLRHGLKAFYRNFSLEVRFGKSLWVKDRATGVSVTLWDVGSFFQQSFVKALQTWQVETDHLDNIIRQKANRSSFSSADIADIEEYCDQELEALVMLMQQFRDALEACNLRISRWHGPGAIAGRLYEQHSIKRHKKVCPDEITRAAQYAYGGGRIELIRQGHYDGSIYNYDVRSCYPWAIAGLPSLRYASWKHYSGDGSGSPPVPATFSLYRVRWHFRDRSPFYPLRHRHVDGSVCYPQTGVSSWCWTPEFELLERYFPGQYEVLEAYVWDAPAPERPFEWVADMYERRMQWKAQEYGAERILKLGLNSLYGKMIQQLGWQAVDRLPAWHQLEWGGYVTSAARARMFDAAYGCPGVVGFETDGIISTSPLPVELSIDLGGWELSEHQSLTYVQSGFYWLDDKVKYRGFDPGTVTREAVLNGWKHNEPFVEAQLTRHIGLNYAAHTGHWDQWGDWVTADRRLDIGSASSKRIRNCGKACSGCKTSPLLSDGLHDTRPYPEIVTAESAPYPLAWRPEGLPPWKVEALRQSMELPDFDALRYS